MQRRTSRRAGLSLIDAAAGVSILAIGLLAALSALSVGAQLGRSTSESRAAMQAASVLMDEIRASPFADLTTTYADSVRALSSLVEGAPSGDVTVEVSEEPTGNLHWPVYKVVVRVEFDGVSGERDVELASYVTERVIEGLPL